MKHKWNDFNYWLDHGLKRQDYWACFILGLMSALAMPPVYAFPILLFTFPVFYRVLNKSLTTRQAAVKTWLFHFGYFTAGFYWIAWALLVDIAHNWWALPFAIFGLPALMSFYPAMLIAVWHRLAWRGAARLILFVVCLAAGEYLRGVVFTGFPWNLWGYTWVKFLPVLQSVSLFGMYGLTLFTLLFALTPTMWARRREQAFARNTALLTWAIFIVFFAWGAGRLQNTFDSANKDYIVRIVQPNIAQTVKWDPETRALQEEDLWRLTSKPTYWRDAKFTPNLIVWPETAMSLLNTADVRRMEYNLQTQLPRNAVLTAGVMETELDEATKQVQWFNRISVYNSSKRLATYDKSHLVPFGEYLPFQQYWPVKPVAFAEGQFQAGSGVQTLTVPGAPSFSPLICYETLFPGATASNTERPHFILNVTNDAWYGYTTGPFQHLAIAQARAVEEGLPLIRAANTGVSAVIDPLGRITGKLALQTHGILDQPMPPSLQPTFFARMGNTVFFALLALFAVLAWVMQRLQIKKIQHVA